MSTATKPVAYCRVILLAGDEWGNELMTQIAAQVFCDHPDEAPTLVVEVQEHASWYLTFAMLGGKMTVVGSANDAARFDPAVKEFWGRINAMECVYHPWVRRPSVGLVTG